MGRPFSSGLRPPHVLNEPMATAEEFHAYAASLPDIYREIMAAFPRIEPTRRRHFSLAFQSLWADLKSEASV
jgi:hypothetical protein